MDVAAVTAIAPDAPLEKTTIHRRDTGPLDVLIETEFAGICHSDIHHARGEWGRTVYPTTPGHEIVGIVREVGSEVTRHSVGDRVGVGCMVGACHECSSCEAGQEQECERGAVMTYGSPLPEDSVEGTTTQGGYSTHIVVEERMVVSVPEDLDPAAATPLLCAGVTMFSPLRQWNVGPGSKVAVIGMGGLGHVGVQLAVAMGAEVTVLSQTTSKREDSLKFGAVEHYATAGEEGMQTLRSLRGSFDVILNTVSANLPLDRYLAALRPRGVMVEIGIPSEPMSLRAGSVTGGRKILTGSMIGGIPETQEMLDFCAEHGITAQIELISADKINEAYDRVVSSDVRYRFVIDAKTF
ncbi:alcohol dehydrogenase [Dietzia sp. NCCP-2495]|uniref:NAD(P)-dependent alcohol dehydrogenase n=1 Tax=Dietzia sp. NCCP-2495 TaxID=2934675 RepID=UPI0022303873|nr:NAD(P)-dependent alcohol dehydrogenase [Dietzia sp. NCCP-2495]GLB65188.1 alcohol dehydrogenase [Dietzia sp. NCCP-2495]